jgi:hypothetical protein
MIADWRVGTQVMKDEPRGDGSRSETGGHCAADPAKATGLIGCTAPQTCTAWVRSRTSKLDLMQSRIAKNPIQYKAFG